MLPLLLREKQSGTNMSYNNFLYLINDAVKNNHIELALESLKTFRAADVADVVAQLPIENIQKLLLNLPDCSFVFSHLLPHI